MEGWIKLHRKLLDWEWYGDSKSVHLFLHLLLKANHKDKKHRGILIKGGQLLTGRHKLSEETGLSVQNIRTILERLKSTSEITIKSTNRSSLITLVNWGSYQSDAENQPADQPTSQPASNQQVTTNKNEKNEKNIYSDGFEDFYQAYPRHVGKANAKKVYLKLMKEGVTHEEIIRGVKAYNAEIRKRGTGKEYIKYPSSWLNGRRWEDEFEEVKKQNNQVRDMKGELFA